MRPLARTLAAIALFSAAAAFAQQPQFIHANLITATTAHGLNAELDILKAKPLHSGSAIASLSPKKFLLDGARVSPTLKPIILTTKMTPSSPATSPTITPSFFFASPTMRLKRFMWITLTANSMLAIYASSGSPMSLPKTA
jgi:hypothetical protein